MSEARDPLICGCYLLIVQNAERTYSMVCSWATPVADRLAVLCIGAQSETGKLLREGVEFSLNVLLREQLDLARQVGTQHSSAVDKLADVALETRSGVTWLVRAKKRMRCRVDRFLDVAPGSTTRGVVVEILAPVEEQDGEPLLLDEVFRGA